MRLHHLVLPCLLALTGVLASAASAGAAEFVPGELIVRFKPGVSGPERADARRERGATVERALPVPGVQVLDLPAGQGVRRAAASFEDDPRVLYAEPNYVARPRTHDPANPLLHRLWGLHNDGLLGGLADADIDAPEAWAQQATSPAVKVAVVDTGVRLTHPDLQSQLEPGDDFVDTTPGDTDPSDEDGHGTHVAGIIGARGDDGYGVTGVSKDVRIIPLRVIGDNGAPVSAIVQAIEAASAAGAVVVNMSLGAHGYTFPETLRTEISQHQNMLFVVAAGNEGGDNDVVDDWPCNYVPPAGAIDNVLCVAASDDSDSPAVFTNYGLENVDIAAPGVAVLSTYLPSTPYTDHFGDLALPGWDQSSPAGTSSWEQAAVAAGGNDGNPGIAVTPRDTVGDGSTAYEPNAETILQLSAPETLPGGYACEVVFDFGLQVDAAGGDVFTVEAAAASTGPWVEVYSAAQDVAPGTLVRRSLPAELGSAPVHLRLRFSTDADNLAGGPFGGPYFDWLDITCHDRQLSGTSMAAPHVAGAAALVMAREPGLTIPQLRTRLLDTVDPLACWAGLTASGGRLNVARALDPTGPYGDGAEGCPVTVARQAPPPPPDPTEPPPSPQPLPPPPPGDDPGVTPPRVDDAAPVVTATAARRYRASTLIRSGLRARIRCDEECRIRTDVLVGRRTAKRLGIRGRRFGSSYVLLGRARSGLSRAGSKTVITRISRRAHRDLRRARRVRLVLRVLARDEHGNSRAMRRSLTVRR